MGSPVALTFDQVEPHETTPTRFLVRDGPTAYTVRDHHYGDSLKADGRSSSNTDVSPSAGVVGSFTLS